MRSNFKPAAASAGAPEADEEVAEVFEFDGADGSIAQDNEGSLEVVAHSSGNREGVELDEGRIAPSTFYNACITTYSECRLAPQGDACFTRRTRFISRAAPGSTKSWQTTARGKDVLAVAVHDAEVDIVLCRPIKRLYLRACNAKIRLLISAPGAMVDWPPIAAAIYAEGGSSSVVLDRCAIAVSPATICATGGGSVCGFSPIGDRQANGIYVKGGVVTLRTSRGLRSPFEAYLSYATYKYDSEERRWLQFNPEDLALAASNGSQESEPLHTRQVGMGQGSPVFIRRSGFISHMFGIHGELHSAATMAAPWQQQQHQRLVGRASAPPAEALFGAFIAELTAGGDTEGEFDLAEAMTQSLATPQPPTGRRAELEKKVERPVFVLANKGASAAPAKEVPEADACVICKSAPKTHFSIGCAHLLYCDECVHRIVETNEWKACMICNAPSRGLSYKLF